MSQAIKCKIELSRTFTNDVLSVELFLIPLTDMKLYVDASLQPTTFTDVKQKQKAMQVWMNVTEDVRRQQIDPDYIHTSV